MGLDTSPPPLPFSPIFYFTHTLSLPLGLFLLAFRARLRQKVLKMGGEREGGWLPYLQKRPTFRKKVLEKGFLHAFRARSHTHIHKHRHAQAEAEAEARACARAHTHTHTHTHKHTHTHTHTHKPSVCLSIIFFSIVLPPFPPPSTPVSSSYTTCAHRNH